MEVLLVDVVAEDLGKMSCQHDLWIILNTEGADVVTTLLAESGLVLVLFKIKNICFGFFLQIFKKKKKEKQCKRTVTYVTDDVSGGFGCYNRNCIFGKEVAFVDGVHKTFTISFL